MDFMNWFIRYRGAFPRHDLISPSNFDALWANSIRAAACGKRVKTESGKLTL
jgi:hypothetical protein